MLAMSDPPDFEQLFLQNLATIERAIRHTASRHRLREEDREDFRSWVMVRLIENDYAKLRQCRDWNNCKGFLYIVVSRLGLDYLDHLYGKWRPSAEAQEMGEVGIRLERLLRDFTFDEAVQILQINFKVDKTAAELAEMASRLPNRFDRRPEGEEGLENHPVAGTSPDEEVLAKEQLCHSRKVFDALTGALSQLPDEDRLLLRLHFVKGWSWKKISDALQLDQKALYPRKNAILADLKEALHRAGITEEDMLRVLQSAGLAFWFKSFRKPPEGPSKEKD